MADESPWVVINGRRGAWAVIDGKRMFVERSRDVKRQAWRKPAFRYSAAEIARLDRLEEREKKATARREKEAAKEKKRKANLKKKAKAEAEAREERNRRIREGLPDPNLKLSSSQPQLSDFFPVVGRRSAATAKVSPVGLAEEPEQDSGVKRARVRGDPEWDELEAWFRDCEAEIRGFAKHRAVPQSEEGTGVTGTTSLAPIPSDNDCSDASPGSPASPAASEKIKPNAPGLARAPASPSQTSTTDTQSPSYRKGDQAVDGTVYASSRLLDDNDSSCGGDRGEAIDACTRYNFSPLSLPQLPPSSLEDSHFDMGEFLGPKAAAAAASPSSSDSFFDETAGLIEEAFRETGGKFLDDIFDGKP